MLFMNMLVNQPMVQKPMGIKESNFFHNQKEQKFQNHRVKFWQNFVVLSSTPSPKFVTQGEKERAKNEGVDEDCLDQMFELLWVHRFIGTRLDFVFA